MEACSKLQPHGASARSLLPPRMIIDVAFVDVLMIFSTALNIVLRASRHLTSGHSSLTGAASSSQSFHLSHFEDGLGKPREGSRRRRLLDALKSAPSKLRREGGWWATSLPENLHDLSTAGNVLSLISNCLTHLLRHSQVLYAVLLVMCDVVMACRERPQRRGGYMLSLLSLLVMLYILHEHTAWFSFGDWCGYVNGLLQVFLLGAAVGGADLPTGGPHSNSKQANQANHHHVVVEYTLERTTACVSTLCYLAMLLDEGDAVYSSHSEFVRWYVANAALLCHDAVLLWQFLRHGGGISNSVTIGNEYGGAAAGPP